MRIVNREYRSVHGNSVRTKITLRTIAKLEWLTAANLVTQLPQRRDPRITLKTVEPLGVSAGRATESPPSGTSVRGQPTHRTRSVLECRRALQRGEGPRWHCGKSPVDWRPPGAPNGTGSSLDAHCAILASMVCGTGAITALVSEPRPWSSGASAATTRILAPRVCDGPLFGPALEPVIPYGFQSCARDTCAKGFHGDDENTGYPGLDGGIETAKVHAPHDTIVGDHAGTATEKRVAARPESSKRSAVRSRLPRI